MKVINITPNIRVIERVYHANNRICIDYAMLFTKNNEERFCGYVRSVPTKEEIDYTELYKAFDAHAELPEWINLCTK